MKKLFFPLLVILSSLNAQTNYTIGIDLSIIDRKTDPKKDLMRFAAGNWFDKTEIPASEVRYGSFSEIQDRNEANLKKIIQDILADKTLAPGSEKKKLQDFYNSAMDSVSLNKLGITPLKAEMLAIDAIKTKADIFKIAARLHKSSISTMFSFRVDADLKNSKKNSCYLAQGGMGLPTNEFYLSPNYKEIQTLYKTHIEKTFALLKYYPESAQAYANKVYEIEAKLATGCMSMVEQRDVAKLYNKMSKAELKKLAPNFNIDGYFLNLGIKSPDTFIVSQPNFYKNLSGMLDAVSIADWKLYFKWTLIKELSPFLSDDFVKENFAFYNGVLTGASQMKPRWKNSLMVTDKVLGEALGKIFVEKHFNAEAKKRVNTMVDNLIAAFKDRINSRPWMSASTKVAGVQKLDKIYRKLGFPDKWEDYSKMQIKNDSYVANMMRIGKWKFNKMVAEIGKPVDKTKWGMSPPTVNAYYNPSANEIAFPAGIMQPPFFDPNADDAFNYGIMGAVIGHELSHGFDDEGSKFDGDGNFKKWWADEDVEKFETLTKPLINQFSSFVAIDTFHVNGKLTLGENIGDLGGLTMAYYGYKKSLNGKPSDTREGFTGEQRFFIAWAQGWKIKMRDQFLRQMVATNPHSPGYFRAIGPPSNMPEFYEAFGVKEGDGMYRKPEVRVSIW